MKSRALCRWRQACRLTATVALGALVAGCGDPMPETRPADLRMSYSNVAGMLARGGLLYISGTSAQFRYRFDKEKGERTATLSAAELDDLWARLRRAKFTEIRSRDKGPVYDRGGTTITLEWGKHRYTAQNAGNLFIRNSSLAAWRQVRGAFGRLIVKHFRRLPNGGRLPKKAAPRQ